MFLPMFRFLCVPGEEVASLPIRGFSEIRPVVASFVAAGSKNAVKALSFDSLLR